MFEKNFMFAVLFIVILVSGCATNDQAGDALDRTIDGENEFDQFQEPERDDELSSKLGYVHYNKDELEMDNENNHYVAMDRNKMADMITRLIIRTDNFEEVATLVTDEEVLIAYEKPENMDREEAATVAKKTALSTLPRFYHVYVSDQPTTFRDIQSLQNSNTANNNYENTLQSIIDDMKETPQGEEIDDSNETYDNEDNQNNYETKNRMD
ncbi:YhcN/YlaJ family sporulation lipoprotein [Aquibacillus albus]|uniref:Sporulation protein n=1 Tax=Aquibacillus albus TaxID=1168171 RepID=A0ABS2MYU3_9BACI|nr:YhcN/YlaJ family sporulation lipoprotein [Aquibacillus albus]MBM7570968.1 hypothetical protein [Aquibacillus albus]